MNNIVRNAKQITELAEKMRDRRTMTYDEYIAKYSTPQITEPDTVSSIRLAFRNIMAAILGKPRRKRG